MTKRDEELLKIKEDIENILNYYYNEQLDDTVLSSITKDINNYTAMMLETYNIVVPEFKIGFYDNTLTVSVVPTTTEDDISDDKKHLQWIYNRLIEVHKENENYDYMLKFKEIIING